MNKIILDLCGGTGSWSKPYEDAGYDVRVITLPEWNVVHFVPDCYFKPHEKVYGVLAAPPCTHFSLARTTAKTPRDLLGAMENVRACLQIIWDIRADYKIKFWALENPVGYLRQFLGKPPLTFYPCDYGDPWTKKTDLWGFYNMPKKNHISLTEEQKARCAINNRELPPGKTQAERRAITPPAFAKAFFNANK